VEARHSLMVAMTACEGGCPVQWMIWEAEIEIAFKNWDEATRLARRVVELQPENPDALTVLGLVSYLNNDCRSATAVLKSALQHNPGHSPATNVLQKMTVVERVKEEGNQFFRSGNFLNALEKYTETIDLIGTDEKEGGGGVIRSVLLSNRAATYFKLERYPRALEDTSLALALQPTSFKALRTQGRVQFAQGYFQDAVSTFQRAQELSSSDTSSADFKAISEELRQAITAVQKCEKKDYYQILSISKTATLANIKKAYKKRSLLYHPDKGGNPEQFKLVLEAYNALSSATTTCYM